MTVTNKSNTLNWRDASKELPEVGRYVLILMVYLDGDSHMEVATFTKKSVFTDDYGEPYSSADYKIKYWIYLDEIPLPED